MSRKYDDDGANLDLMLDTICNTFGGVLFISMLVVILLNISPTFQAADQLPDDAAQAELIEWEMRLADSRSQLDRLQAEMRLQSRAEQRLANPALLELVQRFQESQATSVELLESRTAGLSEIAESRKTINDRLKQLQQNAQKNRITREQLEATETRMGREIENRTRSAELPLGGQSDKQEQALFIREGRLCSYLPQHPEETVLQPEGAPAFIAPNPSAGIRITSESVAAIDERLDAYNADTQYLTLFVWPDSFEQCQIVKDRIVAKGLRYSLQLTPADQQGIPLRDEQIERNDVQ